MNRDDVIRIVEGVLSELTISVRSSHWTNPNDRVVELRLGDRVLSSDTFNITQTTEYED